MSQVFWSSKNLESYDGVAIATSNSQISYVELNRMVGNYATFLSNKGLKNQLAFLPMLTDVNSIVRYLACLRSSVVPLLLPKNIDEDLIQNLTKIYNPAVKFGLKEIEDIQIYKDSISSVGLPKELSVLLSTSGSTGSSKLVKLSSQNLDANAESIREYLKISSKQIAHCALPLSYSYGLSVLNSHLSSGACVFLSELNPFSPGYYDEIRSAKITSISGVPFFYQMLERTGFFEKNISSLNVITQAGGKLNEKLIEKFCDFADHHDIDFFVMYGQTEATARISYVPCKMLKDKIGSIGIPIPGGSLELSASGELIYHGPNVMLGYAESYTELFNKNNTIGSLHTGDIARVDNDGYYYITGRKKRFLKLAGSRFGLDEIETYLENEFQESFLATGKDDSLEIIVEGYDMNSSEISEALQAKFAITRTYIKVKHVEQIIRKENGKKDYTFYLGDENDNK